MQFDRRELLKYFGIGTVIAPVHAASGVTARLTGIPLIEPAIAADVQPKTWYDRLKWNPFEAVWLRFWQIEDRDHGILEMLVGHEPTQQERECAAALTQWLGTNVGHSFLVETLEASGYRVTWDDSLPNFKPLKQIQHANVWVKDAKPFSIERRGRKILIVPGEVGGIETSGWLQP